MLYLEYVLNLCVSKLVIIFIMKTYFFYFSLLIILKVFLVSRFIEYTGSI